MRWPSPALTDRRRVRPLQRIGHELKLSSSSFRARAFEARIASVLALGVLFSAGPLRAHAPPKATGIYWAPTASSDASRTFVRTNRGLIVIGPDGARSPPALLCNDAWQASLVEIAPVLPTAESVLVGSFLGGLVLAEKDLCSFSTVGLVLGDRRLVDLKSAGGTYFALTSATATEPGVLFASTDGGGTWNARADILAFGTALISAPSDAELLYVSQQVETEDGAPAGELGFSEDAGQTFSFQPIPIGEDEVRPFVVGVDPTDSRRVFVRTLAANGDMPERLLLSEDAGENFREVASMVGPLEFAMDGDHAYLAGRDGVLRSDDGGLTFTPLPGSPSHVGCLVARDEYLYVCGNSELEFGVLRSSDAGTTFDWYLRFPDVTIPVSCPTGSSVGQSCLFAFEDWKAEQQPAGGGGGLGGGGAAGMAGASAGAGGAQARPPAESKPSSGCRLSPQSNVSSIPSLLACLWIAGSLLARRNRRWHR